MLARYNVCMRANFNVTRIDQQHEQFPEQLRQIPGAPRWLYVAGTLPSFPAVAIVGSRRITGYGRRVTQTIAGRLAAAGRPIVSGLAFGVDTIAHQAALEVGGSSVAVLPCGLDNRVLSPRANLELAERIYQHGALVSEYPPETTARKEHFLDRNRLISGLADIVVVVEAALPSGSLITAEHAANQGREVWAVPGPIESPTSAGTNNLISEGAHPLHDIDAFLAAVVSEAPLPMAVGILRHLDAHPRHIDELVATSALSPRELDAELTKLELVGVARNIGGRHYVRV